MSIYATLWSIQIQDPVSPFTEPRWVEVAAQAVPPHIGSPTPGRGYEKLVRRPGLSSRHWWFLVAPVYPLTPAVVG